MVYSQNSLQGDPLYGVGGVPIQQEMTSVPGDCDYFLHAYLLSFIHPRIELSMKTKCYLLERKLGFLKGRPITFSAVKKSLA
jgi:23S rRNA-/tRNA-specific pseudouridylate synthase